MINAKIKSKSFQRAVGLALVPLFLAGWHAPQVGIGPGPAVGKSTGWPVPRFESLATDKAYVRAGPGFRYPILWDYHWRDMPVEVIGEFNVWRKVLLPDGATGWIHEALLHGTRGFIVIGGRHTVRAQPTADGQPVAYVEKGVVGVIRRCDAGSAWCRVLVDHRTGWLRRRDFWGDFANEAIK